MFLIAIILSLLHVALSSHEEQNSWKHQKVVNKVPLYEFCHWHTIDWVGLEHRNDESPCNLHGDKGNYIAEKNIPTKLRLYNGRAYVVIERSVGVYSSLSYFDLCDVGKNKECPKLKCFRNCARNQLAELGKCPDDDVNYLINVRDIQFTRDKKAWVLDIGAYFLNESTPVFHRAPRLCLYDVSLATPSQKFCSSFPTRLYNAGNQLGLNAIEVKEDGDKNDFVYIFNAASATIVVYSEKENKFWGIRAALFKAEPSQSLFTFNLPHHKEHKFVSRDGVFSGTSDKYGLFVSAKASDDLYYVSYSTLDDKMNEFMPETTFDISDVGTYNPNGHTYDFLRHKNVLYFIQPERHALVCANKKFEVTEETLQVLSVDPEKLAHLTSIDFYHQHPDNRELYLLSNNLVDIKVNGFDKKKKNFVISVVDLEEVERLNPECLGYHKGHRYLDYPYNTCTRK
ncbi:uncharacterized protein LOC134837392 [Culicoides brevitarsis]|uniref:uncharacterized protein LOC134837392 n=1 Tax=Culicoides brevitarsis TaxID=469753 RepID=UPI00307C7796